MILWKWCPQYSRTFGKISFHSNPKESQCQKGSDYRKIALVSQTVNKCSKFSNQASEIHELTYVQAGFRKGRGTRVDTANIRWIIKNTIDFQKNIYLGFIDFTKAFNCVITINCGKFWKRWGYKTISPTSWNIRKQVMIQQLELDMEQQTVSNRKRSKSRLYVVTLII